MWQTSIELLGLYLILAVDVWLLIDQRKARKLYEAYFAERTRWYAARGKSARKSTASAREADASSELVLPGGQDDGERAAAPLPSDDGRIAELGVLHEAVAEESSEREESPRDSD